MKTIMTRILDVLINSRFSIILLPLTLFVLTLPFSHYAEVGLKVLKVGWPVWLGFGMVPLVYLWGYIFPKIVHKRLNLPAPVRDVHAQMPQSLSLKLGRLGIMLGLPLLGVLMHSSLPVMLSIALAGMPFLYKTPSKP